MWQNFRDVQAFSKEGGKIKGFERDNLMYRFKFWEGENDNFKVWGGNHLPPPLDVYCFELEAMLIFNSKAFL